MKTRVVLGVVLIALILGLIVADELFARRIAISVVLCLLGIGGWIEIAIIGGVGRRARGGSPILFGVGTAGTLYFLGLAWGVGAGWLHPEHEPLLVSTGFLGVLLGSFLAVVFRGDDVESALAPLLLTITGVLLMGWAFSYTLRIYHLEKGDLLAVIFFFGVKGNDIAAYLVGRKLGRTRFLKVSPKKTLEGCAAAFVFSVVYFVVVSVVLPQDVFPWSRGVLVGIILSISSQVGDLCESLIKRAHGVKDSGVLLPEYGGVLDMIDSLLFSAFLFWLSVTL